MRGVQTDGIGGVPGAPLIAQEASAEWTDPTVGIGFREEFLQPANPSPRPLRISPPSHSCAFTPLCAPPPRARSHSRPPSSPAIGRCPHPPHQPRARAPHPHWEQGNVRHVRCAVIGSCGPAAPRLHPASSPAGVGASEAAAGPPSQLSSVLNLGTMTS